MVEVRSTPSGKESSTQWAWVEGEVPVRPPGLSGTEGLSVHSHAGPTCNLQDVDKQQGCYKESCCNAVATKTAGARHSLLSRFYFILLEGRVRDRENKKGSSSTE